MSRQTKERIAEKCDEIKDLIIRKNQSYGDSALNPLDIFTKGNAVENLYARIDDKLARVKSEPDAFGEDVAKDLAGYFILLLIAQYQQKKDCSRTY